MIRTILSSRQMAALRHAPIQQWTSQPMQQHLGEGDGDGGGDDTGDSGDGTGSGKDGDNDNADDSGDSGDGDGDDGDSDDKKLGPAGEKALAAIKAEKKAERTRRIAVEKELRELKAGKKPADDDATKRAEEAVSKANARVLKSEVRAAAAGVLADPSDAPRFLDLDQFEVGEDGDVDQAAIADAIKELVEEKPYLAAQGGKKKPPPKPDSRQGGGGGKKMSGKDLGKAEADKRFGNRK